MKTTRKNLFNAALALSVATLSLTTTSCRDEDDTVSAAASAPASDVMPASITKSRESDIISLPVKAKGDWTLSMDYGSSRKIWFSPQQTSGNGSKTVTFVLEPNVSRQSRTCTVTITEGTKKSVCRVTQTALPDPSKLRKNGTIKSNFTMFEDEVPLGFGFSLLKSDANDPKDQIFFVHNFGNDEVKKAFPSITNSLRETSVKSSYAELLLDENNAENSEAIHAEAEVSLSFNLFKFTIDGAYSTNRDGKTKHKIAGFLINSPVKRYSYRPDLIVSKARDNSKDIELVMSPSFIEARKKIEECFNTTGKEKDAEKLINNLITDFGSVYVKSITTGAMCKVNAYGDTDDREVRSAIEGNLKAAVSSYFSITGSASYNSKVKNDKTTVRFEVSADGGSDAAKMKLHSQLMSRINWFEKLTDTEKTWLINQRTGITTGTAAQTTTGQTPDGEGEKLAYHLIPIYMNQWFNSVKDSKEVTNIKWDVKGIWELFDNDKAKEAIKERVAKEYKDYPGEKLIKSFSELGIKVDNPDTQTASAKK